MKTNYITAQQFDEYIVVMVLVKGCHNCDYYEEKSNELNIPILKLKQAIDAPFAIIELGGTVVSPALWVDGSKTVAPSSLLMQLVSDYLRQLQNT